MTRKSIAGVAAIAAAVVMPAGPQPAAAGGGTQVCGGITAPATWNAAGSPYLICADGFTVNATTLTLDAGGGPITIQAQGAHGGLNVLNGSLVTAHTAPGATVSFDGPSSTPGSWPGIRVREWHPPAVESVSLAYVSVEHALTGLTFDDDPLVGAVPVALDHVTVGDASLDGVSGANRFVTLTNDTVHDTGRDGVSGAGYALTDSTVDHAARIGILNGALLLGATGSGTVRCANGAAPPFQIARDTVTNSGSLSPGFPAMFTEDASALMPTGGSGANMGGGNWNDAIAIDGCVSAPITWVSPTQSSSMHTLGDEVVGLDLVAKLTVPAGAVVKGGTSAHTSGVSPTATIQVHQGGFIDATAGGAIFTSLSDNASGAALCPSVLVHSCTPAAGDFGGISVAVNATNSNPGVSMTGATVQYAATALSDTYVAGSVNPDVILNTTTIQHVGTGLSVSGDTLMTNGSIGDAQGRGVDDVDGALTLNGVTVHNTGGDGVHVDAPGDGHGLGVFVINDTVQQAGGTGIWARGSDPVVSSDNVTGSTGPAISLDGTYGMGPGLDVDGNSGSGNGADAIVLNGTLTANLSWVTAHANSSGQALGYVARDLTMNGPLSFTVPANAVVKADSISLNGASLDASAGGATFAVSGDDSVGLPVARFLAVPSTQAVGPTGLSLQSSSDGNSHGAAAIHAAQLREGWSVTLGSGATSGPAGAPVGLSIDGSAVQASLGSYGVIVDSGTATLSCDRIENNRGGVAVNVPGTTISQSDLDGNAASAPAAYDLGNQPGVAVSAQQNWWGQAGGPVAGQVEDAAHANTSSPLSAASGCAPASGPRSAASVLSPSPMAFGTEGVGAPHPATVTIVSDGSASDTVTGISVSGDTADFSAAATCLHAMLNPGRSCGVVVTYTPHAPGGGSASLTVVDSAGSHVVSLTGTGGSGPKASFSPNPIDFGAVGATNPLPVVITNQGDAPLVLQTVGAGAYWVGDDECSGRTLAPAASCAVEIGTAAQPAADTLTVSTNEPSGTDSVPIVAPNPAPVVNLTPASHDYGSQLAGTLSAPVAFTLTVHSSVPVNLDQYGASPSFTITGDSCSWQVVLDGASCHLSIVFAPTRAAPGAVNGIAAATGYLNGTGGPVDSPVPNITLSGVSVFPVLQLNPQSGLFFPSTQVHTAAPAQVAQLVNTGTAAGSVSSVSLAGPAAGDYSILADACSGSSLNPGSSCGIEVGFVPLASGFRQATLVVHDVEGTQTIPLVGGAFTLNAAYRMVASDGGIFSFGAPFYGSMGGKPITAPIVGMAAPIAFNGPSLPRYFMVGSDGNVYDFGLVTPTTKANLGNLLGTHLNQPIVGMAATPDGNGYWLVASDGGIFPFGDAVGYGSTGNIRLNQPIVGMAASPDGRGYWMVAADGGIFPFGDATPGLGSTGNIHLNQPIVGMASSPTGRGYWLVAADGGIFPFGDATQGLGSTGNIHLNQPIVGMASTPSGRGYWLVAADGGIFPFGDAPGLGSMGGTKLVKPVVGMTSAVMMVG